MMTAPQFLRSRPVKGKATSMGGLVSGVTRMAHAIESLSVQNGRVDWANGSPKIILNVYKSSAMVQSSPFRFFRSSPKPGKPQSLSGMADGIAAMAFALESLSIHGGRVTWSRYVPTLHFDVESERSSAQSQLAPMHFFKKSPKSGDGLSTDGFGDGIYYMATAIENMSVAGGRVDWANDEPKIIFEAT